jgi:hypothetical protein
MITKTGILKNKKAYLTFPLQFKFDVKYLDLPKYLIADSGTVVVFIENESSFEDGWYFSIGESYYFYSKETTKDIINIENKSVFPLIER